MIMQVLADLARDGDRGLEDVDLRAVGARHLERRDRRGVGDALPRDRRGLEPLPRELPSPRSQYSQPASRASARFGAPPGIAARF